MARRVQRSRFVRPAPRTKMWIGAGVGRQTLTQSASTLLSVLGASALALRPFTVLRTHVEVLWSSDQAAVTEVPFGSYGWMVVSEAAAGVGITAIPNPSGIDGDPDADWFVWQAMSTKFEFLSSVGFDGSSGSRYVIDSKAMRKVGADDQIVVLVDVQAAGGVDLVTNGRQLIQLH